MLPEVLGQALCLPAEALINRVLKQDPQAMSRLARQEGRLLSVDIETLGRFNVRVQRDGITLSTTADADAEVTLRGTTSDFIALARAEDKANSLINSAIDIDGDTELALTLTRTLQTLDIDWEALIQPLTGSLLAHQIGKGLRGLLRWSKDTGSTYRTAGKEYLEDEIRVVTPAPLLNNFARDVDTLRLATDRLEARIAQLENNKNSED